MSTTTVLVVGASGLIGGRLLEALRHDATIRVRAASRAAHAWPAGVDGVVLDGSADALALACEGASVVVNLAAMGEAACADDPEGALMVNVGGTLRLVTAATRARVSRFVQLSTAKVYGPNPHGTVTEATPTRPRSDYAITHLASEHYAARHQHAVILRLSNGFGAPIGDVPGAWRVIVNEFCRQAVVDGCIALRGDGAAWRSFVPMHDVVAAIVAAARTLPAGTFNLGGCAATLEQMAARTAKVAQDVLGTTVTVRLAPKGSESTQAGAASAPLDYRSDRLRSLGIALDASVDDELARTLRAAAALTGRVRG